MLPSKSFMLTCLIFVVATLNGCKCGGGGGGGGGSPPADPTAPGGIWATFNFTGIFPGDASRNVRWTVTLLEAERADGRGRTSEIVLDRSYTVRTNADGSASATEIFGDLKAGRWRVTCTTGVWAAQCEKRVLAGGTASAIFKDGEVGCR